METASDLHLHREQLSPSTVMHIASTASYTGKRGYPPTYTQACAQVLEGILAWDRAQGLSYAGKSPICQCLRGGYKREHRRTS